MFIRGGSNRKRIGRKKDVYEGENEVKESTIWTNERGFRSADATRCSPNRQLF